MENVVNKQTEWGDWTTSLRWPITERRIQADPERFFFFGNRYGKEKHDWRSVKFELPPNKKARKARPKLKIQGKQQIWWKMKKSKANEKTGEEPKIGGEENSKRRTKPIEDRRTENKTSTHLAASIWSLVSQNPRFPLTGFLNLRPLKPVPRPSTVTVMYCNPHARYSCQSRLNFWSTSWLIGPP